MRKVLKFIFSRKFIIGLLLLLQIGLLVFSFAKLSEHYAIVYGALTVLSFVLVYYIINRDDSPEYKLAWVVPLLIFPVFTAGMYVFFKAQIGRQLFRKNYMRKMAETKAFLTPDDAVMQELNANDTEMGNLAAYIWNYGGFPVYKNTTIEYFPLGEQKFTALKHELAAAKYFIFLEYFIIAEGKMWGEILEILQAKAAAGVDVRLLYDGFGSQMRLPEKYDRYLNSVGIKTKVFNPFKPFLSTSQNNRDHRKICVIDGHTAFNGGINLADEYINRIVRFGHWKDTSVMLKGDAVFSFTMMFLQMWELTEIVSEDYDYLHPHMHHRQAFASDGFVIPFGDAPLDHENVGKLVYLDFINKAKDYIFITTPYLILDSDMITSLTFASKSGVDVRIIVPGTPDKKYIYSIGKSYYKTLIMAGVKLYEYSEGFVHAKSFVSDDVKAIVGTINLDFRSLYLHFECATLMYKSICVGAVKQDFVEMLDKCHRVTIEDCDGRSLPDKLVSGALRIFAPLL